jgi:hypothetical protein
VHFLMNEQELQKALQQMRGYIEREVAVGFRSEEHILTGLVEFLSDEYDGEELRPHAERLTHELIEAHLRQQATWPSQTDCDRLDEVFAELERAGIVARQDFSCCGNCGSAEIWDEMEAVSRRGQRVRGYTFYHMQDTEAAVEEGGIYLAFGAVQEGTAPALEIARQVVETIQRHSLNVEWNGKCGNRIFVRMDWKRRRQA